MAFEDAPERVAKGLGKYPVPVLLLARLATDTRERRKGLGAALLRHVFLKAVNAAEIAGLRAIFVDAKNDAAAQFYAQYGFLPSGSQRLYILMKDVKKVMSQPNQADSSL